MTKICLIWFKLYRLLNNKSVDIKIKPKCSLKEMIFLIKIKFRNVVITMRSGSVFNVLCITLYIIVCSFVFIILGIVLYVIPPITTSCYPFIIYFGHCIVCHSSNYDFFLPFYYLFWALYCMSFLQLRLLTTLLLSSKFFS